MTERKGLFAAFADDDEETTTNTVTKAAPKKTQAPKPVEKKEEKPQTARPVKQIDATGFDGVTGQDSGAQRGGRGGRGGRGAPRGGRGGERGGFRGGERGAFRGDRRPRVEGEEGQKREFRPRVEGEEGQRREYKPRVEGEEGQRREFRPRTEGEEGQRREFRPRTEGGEGRGRGTRRPPRVQEGEGAAVEGDEGIIIAARKEGHTDAEHKERRFTGKPRERAHPYDRKDGTGRGRGVAKGGAGKANWGTPADEIAQGTPVEVKEGETPVEEAKVEDAPVVEAEVVEERRPVIDEEEEENKNKLTLTEYLASKKRSTLKKETRAHEETKKPANLEAAAAKTEKVVPLVKNLKDQEVYNIAVGKTELANLLQFQGQEDEIYIERDGPRRGGRGGRGGARGGARGGKPEGGQHRGGRQQQLRLDDNAFPTLA